MTLPISLCPSGSLEVRVLGRTGAMHRFLLMPGPNETWKWGRVATYMFVARESSLSGPSPLYLATLNAQHLYMAALGASPAAAAEKLSAEIPGFLRAEDLLGDDT